MRTDFPNWENLWHALEAGGDAQPCHERLAAAYREPSRHYHSLRHIGECLSEFDRMRGTMQQPAAVEAALWFHDAVYDSRSMTNEEESAAMAVECLSAAGVARRMVDSVHRLIVCTKTHNPGDNPDAALLVDIDLAILGQPASRFWEYEDAIRAEYAWVPATTFAQKRTEILERFLARPSIYRSENFRNIYEAAARRNLAAAIAAMKSS